MDSKQQPAQSQTKPVSPKGKRVVIVVENLPAPLDRRVWQESQALRDAGYQVTVICPKMRGFNASAENIDGIQIYRHWITDEAGGFVGFIGEYASALWGEFWLLWKVWFKQGMDVIHLCNPPDLLFLVAIPFRLLGVKVLYDVHDLWPEMFEAKFNRRGWFYSMVRLAEKCTYKLANAVLATNETVKHVAMTRGGKSESDVTVVRTAPMFGNIDVDPDPALKKGKQFLVGYIGVMGNADGVDYLVRAADHLVHVLKREDTHFLIMGSGAEYDNLVRLRDELGLQSYVDLPGRVTNEFLFTALKTMDVGAACDPKNSYNDGCTMNKTLEYMAFGKPQVLFDIIEGRASAQEAALYVKENSAEKFAEALVELLDDPERREQMGDFGKKRLFEELNWERSVENLTGAYGRLTSK
jgi:glycosyltransferase involved in cell wall biosynthesis